MTAKQPETLADTWSNLAAKAQAGDKQAYAQLLNDIIPFTKSVIAGRLANPDWIDDITQEVLLSVHKSLKTYDPRMPFRPWLTAIIGFRKTDYLRKHYRQRDQKQMSVDVAEVHDLYVTNNEHAGEYKDIEEALNELPEKQRKVFQMIKIEGFTTQEVADKMNMTESAVKVSAHRTMKKLQKKLG